MSSRVIIVSLLACAAMSMVQAAEPGEFAVETNQCAPEGDLRGDSANGQALHLEHCAACHGLTGAADVIVMHMDQETMENQSDPEYMSTVTDEFIYTAICSGGEAIGRSYVMSPWGDFFSDQEIRDLIAWIRTFSDT